MIVNINKKVCAVNLAQQAEVKLSEIACSINKKTCFSKRGPRVKPKTKWTSYAG